MGVLLIHGRKIFSSCRDAFLSTYWYIQIQTFNFASLQRSSYVCLPLCMGFEWQGSLLLYIGVNCTLSFVLRSQVQAVLQRRKRRRKRCAPQSELEQINAMMSTWMKLQKKKAWSAIGRPEQMKCFPTRWTHPLMRQLESGQFCFYVEEKYIQYASSVDLVQEENKLRQFSVDSLIVATFDLVTVLCLGSSAIEV